MTQWNGQLKRIYWESTASCNLRCIHCRRLDVLDHPASDELTTAEAKAMLDDIRRMGRPVFIFSGGEPLVRSDFYELAAYARNLGLPIALATNGTLVDPSIARRLRETGIYYASVSLDGAGAGTHDRFRGAGQFEKTLAGLRCMRDAGIKVQINFTVTRTNVSELPSVYNLARHESAIALYLFLLVPVGCGVQIAESQMLSADEVERWLLWVSHKDHKGPLAIKAICAPHIYRVDHEEYAPADPIPSERKGCLAGLHMCFISHRGEVFPCGYLPTSAGSIRSVPFSLIWNDSPLFKQLRDSDLLQGRCGACEFKDVCGGCRARAYYSHHDVLAEEPYCLYAASRL